MLRFIHCLLAHSRLTKLQLTTMYQKFFLYLCIASLISACATTSPTPDPLVGVWDYELHHLPQGEPIGIMTISKTEDGYAISLNENILKDVAFEDNKLVSGHFIGEGYHVDVKGTFEGSSFEGMIDAKGNTFRMTAVKQE